jgi:predicted P-loop ATPase/GTPase
MRSSPNSSQDAVTSNLRKEPLPGRRKVFDQAASRLQCVTDVFLIFRYHNSTLPQKMSTVELKFVIGVLPLARSLLPDKERPVN